MKRHPKPVTPKLDDGTCNVLFSFDDMVKLRKFTLIPIYHVFLNIIYHKKHICNQSVYMNNMQKSVSGAGVQLSVCQAKGPRYYHEHTYVWVLSCSLPWAEVLVDGHHRSMRTTPSQTWVDVLENQVVPMDMDARRYKVAVAALCWLRTIQAWQDLTLARHIYYRCNLLLYICM